MNFHETDTLEVLLASRAARRPDPGELAEELACGARRRFALMVRNSLKQGMPIPDSEDPLIQELFQPLAKVHGDESSLHARLVLKLAASMQRHPIPGRPDGDELSKLSKSSRMPRGLLADMVSELDPHGEDWKHRRGLLQGRLRRAAGDAVVIPLLFWNRARGSAPVAYMRLERVAGGCGDFHPVPAQGFVSRDEAWREAEANVRAYLQQEGLWPTDEDVRWELRLGGADATSGQLWRLEGASAGAAVALGVVRLMGLKMGLELPERWRPVLQLRDLTGSAVSAKLSPDGSLDGVGYAWEKTHAALQRCRPPCHTVVLAGEQEIPTERLEPIVVEKATGFELFHLTSGWGTSLELMRAARLEDAVRSLAWNQSRRWNLDMEALRPPPDPQPAVIRKKFIHEVRRHAAEMRRGFLLITGDMGVGKTTAMTQLIHALRSETGREPLAYFLPKSVGRLSRASSVAEAFYLMLQREYAFVPPEGWALWSPADRLHELMLHVSRGREAGDPVQLLLLEAADQVALDRRPEGDAVDLIPETLRNPPEGFVWIITARPRKEPWLAHPGQVRELEFDDLVEGQRDAAELLEERNRRLADPMADSFMNRIQQGSKPLVMFTLNWCFEKLEMAAVGEHEAGRQEQLRRDALLWQREPVDLVWEDLVSVLRSAEREGAGREEALRILLMTALAGEALTPRLLSELELLDAAGRTRRVLALAGSLYESAARLEFRHPGYGRALRGEEMPDDPLVREFFRHVDVAAIIRAARKSLIDACQRAWSSTEPGEGRRYAIRRYPQLLLEADQTQACAELLCDFEFPLAKARAGQEGELLGDYGDCLDRLPSASRPEEGRQRKAWEAFAKQVEARSRWVSLRQRLDRETEPAQVRQLEREREDLLAEWRDRLQEARLDEVPFPSCPPNRFRSGEPKGVPRVEAGGEDTSERLEAWRGWFLAHRGHAGDPTFVAESVALSHGEGSPVSLAALARLKTQGVTALRPLRERRFEKAPLMHTMAQSGAVSESDTAWAISRHSALLFGDDSEATFQDELAWHGLSAYVALTRDGTKAAHLGEGPAIHVWEVRSGRPVTTPKAVTPASGRRGVIVHCLDISGNGSVLACGSDDGIIRIWQVDGGTDAPQLLQGHRGSVNSVRFNADGSALISGGDDGTVRHWDLRRMQATLLPMPDDGWAPIFSVATSADGTVAAGVGAFSTLLVWDLTQNQLRHEIEIGDSDAWSVALSADGRVVACSSGAHTRAWSAVSGRPRHASIRHQFCIGPSVVSLSADGRIGARSGNDGSLEFWDTKSGDTLERFSLHRTHLLGVALSMDGGVAITQSWDDKIHVWDLRRGRMQDGGGIVHEDMVAALALSRAGKVAISAEGCTLHELLPEGEEAVGRSSKLSSAPPRSRAMPEGFPGHVWAIGLSEDARACAVAGDDNSVRLWDFAKRRWERRKFECVDWLPRAIHPGETRMVVACYNWGDHAAIHWNLRTGRFKVVEAKHGKPEMVWAVGLNGDGSRAASAERSGALLVWDTRTGEAVWKSAGHPRTLVTALALNEDGTKILEGRADGTVRLWSLINGTPALLFDEPGEAITALAWRGEVAAIGRGRTVELFRLA